MFVTVCSMWLCLLLLSLNYHQAQRQPQHNDDNDDKDDQWRWQRRRQQQPHCLRIREMRAGRRLRRGQGLTTQMCCELLWQVHFFFFLSYFTGTKDHLHLNRGCTTPPTMAEGDMRQGLASQMRCQFQVCFYYSIILILHHDILTAIFS